MAGQRILSRWHNAVHFITSNSYCDNFTSWRAFSDLTLSINPFLLYWCHHKAKICNYFTCRSASHYRNSRNLTVSNIQPQANKKTTPKKTSVEQMQKTTSQNGSNIEIDETSGTSWSAVKRPSISECDVLKNSCLLLVTISAIVAINISYVFIQAK